MKVEHDFKLVVVGQQDWDFIDDIEITAGPDNILRSRWSRNAF
jgi:hypothetical protein